MNERFLSYGKSIYNALRNQPYAITTTIITLAEKFIFQPPTAYHCHKNFTCYFL